MLKLPPLSINPAVLQETHQSVFGSTGTLGGAAGLAGIGVAMGAMVTPNLQARTLTNLYNTRSQWSSDAHAALDVAFAAAYGWDAEIREEEALGALLVLNRRQVKYSASLERRRL